MGAVKMYVSDLGGVVGEFDDWKAGSKLMGLPYSSDRRAPGGEQILNHDKWGGVVMARNFLVSYVATQQHILMLCCVESEAAAHALPSITHHVPPRKWQAPHAAFWFG